MDWESIVKWLEGIPGWFIDGVKGFASWLISFLQGSWPSVVDMLGIVVQNPEPVAIGMTVSVFIVLFGLLIGRAIFHGIDRKSSGDSDSHDEDEDEPDATDDVSDFYRDGSSSLFEKRQ